MKTILRSQQRLSSQILLFPKKNAKNRYDICPPESIIEFELN